MHKGEENPLIVETASVKDALFVMTDKGLGAVSVVDEKGRLKGLMTDGDVRRGLEKGVDFLSLPVDAVMTVNPHVIHKENWRQKGFISWKNTGPIPLPSFLSPMKRAGPSA